MLDYRDTLRKEICEVVFTKKNGDERVMLCTLHPDVLPLVEAEKWGKEVKEPNPNVVSVWDIEADAWRSFRVDSIKSFEVVTE